MLYFNACPKCKGSVIWRDWEGHHPPYWECLMCGWVKYQTEPEVKIMKADICQGSYDLPVRGSVYEGSYCLRGRCRWCGFAVVVNDTGRVQKHRFKPNIRENKPKTMVEAGLANPVWMS